MLACDMAVAADDAYFGYVDVRFGSGVVSMFLPWVVGVRKAKELLFTGEDRVPADEMILDVGPKTVQAFGQIFARAGTIIWNGPLGLAELPAFAEGTGGTARALARSAAMSIVGGGDLVAALENLGLADRMSHVSIGGGASLEFLEGKVLPGVAALDDQD